MKIITSFILTIILTMISCSSKTTADSRAADFVRVENGRFMTGDSVYRYVGTNFWYGAILASEGRGGDRQRLARELDELQRLGVNNLRILAGGDGEENVPSHIMPVLQTAPGVYNDTILDGLDYLIADLERRGMKAVVYLNNAWEWSGGYGTYLDWAGEGKTPNPSVDGYQAYMNHVARFVRSDSARAMAARHTRNIVGRTNRYTGRPYTESPAIMSWQIANEPRALASDSLTKEAFAGWMAEQAALIKSIDSRHLVSTGSEGRHGCEGDLALWDRIHSDPNIDYGIIHIWPYNWGWAKADSLVDNVDRACGNALDYIMDHKATTAGRTKPLVLEEFGYPRDGFLFTPGSPVEGRDRFYTFIFDLVADRNLLDGCNFWGWGGFAVPAHESWQPWDEFTGDPAQEAQGLNSVFATDSTTVAIIKAAANRL